jgi:membrane protein YdbS with pleckstrin-like domain
METALEIKQFKSGLKKYKRPVMCLRFLLTYEVFLLIAKYSSIFNTGIIPKDLWSIGIVAGLVMYRFLSIFFVPAILALWIFEVLENKLESHNRSS